MIKNKVLVCLAATAVVVLALSTGCSSPGLTSEQVHRRHYHTVESNLLQIQDDLDAVLLLDRPSRLSTMPVR